MLVIIERELNSLIRNTLERILKKQFKKSKNKTKGILIKLSTRVVSSLIAIYIFNQIKENKKTRAYISYVMICLFVYFLYQEHD